jgi:HEAT repeat protein
MPQLPSANSLCSPPETDALRADLRAADASVRKIALAALGPLLAGEAPVSIVGAIAGALADADARVRELAADALAAAGPRAREALPRLVTALGDPAPRVRRTVASAIALVGAGDVTALAGLVRGLGDADAEVREQCAAALGDLAGAGDDGEEPISAATWGAAGATLAAAARDVVPAARQAAIRALVAFAEHGKTSGRTAEVATTALADPAPEVRIEGLRLLSAANVPAADSLPLLTALLSDPDAGVRRLAARALGRLGADGALAAPSLHCALADSDRLVARAAAEALALVAFAERPWLQYLLQVREFAGSARPELGARAMQLLDAPVEEVAAWLGELVDDADEGIRWNAGLGLWRCGTCAGVARAALSRMLTDHSSALRVAAVVGLLGAGPAAGAESARGLALRLKDDELWVRQLAAVALGAMGPAASIVLPALTEATTDEREEVRNAAAEAVRRITTP